MPEHKENKEKIEGKKDSSLKPDPETLHTTDPQEEMEGPVSSIVQSIKNKAEDNDQKDEDDEKKLQ
jgi:hypothetical protein